MTVYVVTSVKIWFPGTNERRLRCGVEQQPVIRHEKGTGDLYHEYNYVSLGVDIPA
jgi:hypothetical protein